MVVDEISINGCTLHEIIDFYSPDIPDSYHLQQELRLQTQKWEMQY